MGSNREIKTVVTDITQAVLDDEDILASRTARCPYYPLVVDKAEGVTVTDIEGNEFIDLLASAAVINVGHNHPKVVKAIHEQVDKFIHYTPAYMYHLPHTNLMKKLVELTPGNFEKRVAFGLSGGSSVDGAIKAAKIHTGRNHIISFFGSYHGLTYGALSVSGYSVGMRHKVGALLPDVHFIPFPDDYRGKSGEECIAELENILKTVAPPDDVAAVIFEVVQGDAGILLPQQSFYDALTRICKENGILMIADEVQTGFGRTGEMFACNLYGIEPDLLVLGKAIASGLPLSAIVGRKEIMESWKAPTHFFNTSGNAVVCAAALATIDVIEEENLLEKSKEVSAYMVKRFNEMKEKYDCIGDIRGAGLMIGVDIVEDRETRKRAVQKTAKICYRCWELGAIIAFFADCVLRIEPPLTITLQEAEKALDIIEQAIVDVENGLVPDSAVNGVSGL